MIKIVFLRKVLSKQSDAVDNNSGSLNRGNTEVGLPLLRTLLAIWEKSGSSFWEVKDSLGLLAEANLTASRRTLLQRLLPKLHFRCKRFILLLQTEEEILSYGSSTKSWKTWRWVRLDLIFMRYICINSKLDPLTKLSTQVLTYPFLRHLPNDHKDCPNWHRNSPQLKYPL